MPFAKGQSGNPAGRPKGAKDRVTAEARALFVSIMEGEVQHIEDALDGLRTESSEKYLKALAALFPYFMPKQVHTEVTVTEESKTPSWFKDIEETAGLPNPSRLVDE